MSWYLFALGSALFHSLSQLTKKKILQHEHALEFSTVNGLFMVVIISCLLPFFDFHITTIGIFIALFNSILASAGILHMMKAMRHGDISIVSPMTNISPFFLLVIAYVFLGEVPTWNQLGGIVVLLIGTYLLTIDPKHGGALEPFRKFLKSPSIHHMVFAMVTLSFCAALDKYILDNYATPMGYMWTVWVFITMNFFVLDWIRFRLQDIKKDILIDGKMIAVSAIFATCSIMFHYGALVQPGAKVSLLIPVKRLSTLITTIVGGSMFHESNLPIKIVGCMVTLAGAAIVIIS